jgi:hypothetical protein
LRREVNEEMELEQIPKAGSHEVDELLLFARNVTVFVAAVLFLLSLFPLRAAHTCKAVGYFFGSAAYLAELLLLTDFFRLKLPPSELFMVYAFGPLYILMGISTLLH